MYARSSNTEPERSYSPLYTYTNRDSGDYDEFSIPDETEPPFSSFA